MQMQDNTTQIDQQCSQLFLEPYYGQWALSMKHQHKHDTKH